MRSLISVIFNIGVVIIIQSRFWIPVGSVYLFNLIATTQFYAQYQDNILFIAAYAIIFDIFFGILAFIPKELFVIIERY